MALGTTGTLNVTTEMIKNALDAIDAYRTEANNLHKQLTDIVDGLIPADFSGNAATGYKTFYNGKIEPLIDSNLEQYLKALEDICGAIKSQIPDQSGVDESLATENNKLAN